MHYRGMDPAPAWSLVQFTTPGDARPRVGVGVGTGADLQVRHPPAPLDGLSLLRVVEGWERSAPLLQDLDVGELGLVPGAEVVAPLTYPGKVLCAGANYYDHAAEMGTSRPDPDAEPYFFLKAPRTTVVGPGAVVGLPGGRSQVDYEAELAVVVSRRCRDVGPEEAARAVAGYLVADDLSDRGRFPRPDAVAPPFGFDWVAHKSQDGFCPLGPGLVPAWRVPDPHDLAITLAVGEVVKQRSSTAQMVVRVPDLVAAASRLGTLEPGDVILTGTPAGVGMPRGDFLGDGDVVTVTIEGIGTLRHTMAAVAAAPDQRGA